MKNTTHNMYEAPEKQHYKKGYLQRKLEEKDADEEIRNYRLQKMQDTQYVAEEGVVQHVSRRVE